MTILDGLRFELGRSLIGLCVFAAIILGGAIYVAALMVCDWWRFRGRRK